MRFSKTSWLILIIGIFLMSAATLYFNYYQQTNDRNLLFEEISDAQQSLQNINSRKQSLEEELAALQERYDATAPDLDRVQAKFPNQVESIEYDEHLFELAEEHDVQIYLLNADEEIEETTYITIETDEEAVEEEEQEPVAISYLVTYLKAAIEGQLDDIVNYVDSLVKDTDYRSASIVPVEIIQLDEFVDPDDTDVYVDEELDIAARRDLKKYRLNVFMTVYSYENE